MPLSLRILEYTNAIATSRSSGIVCHNLETTDITIASLCGIMSISPATIMPSLTPSPEGANIARIPMIAETPHIPAQYSICDHSAAGYMDFVRIKNPKPTISQLPINKSTTFNI